MTAQTGNSMEAYIDFTAAPVEPVVTLLRDVAMRLAVAALARQCLPPEQWLTEREAERLVGERGSLIERARGWARARKARLVSRFRRAAGAPPESFADAALRMREGAVTEAAWREGVTAELRRRFRIDGGETIPPDLWRALGLRAWGEPEFGRALSEHAELLVRRQALMDLDGFPTIRFSPQTFWLLMRVATTGRNLQRRAGPPQGALPARLIRRFRAWRADYRRRHGRAGRAVELLGTTGRRLALGEPGWANEWDQWLLLEATCAWGRANDPEVAAAITALPLASAYPGLGPSALTRQGASLQARDTVELPPWFMGWLTAQA